MIYYAIFEPGEGGYLVHLPDFEANSFGETLEEALEMATDALSGLVVLAQEKGKLPRPKSYEEVKALAGPEDIVQAIRPDSAMMESYAPKKRVQLMLPANLLNTLDEARKSAKMTRSAWIEKACERALEEE